MSVFYQIFSITNYTIFSRDYIIIINNTLLVIFIIPVAIVIISADLFTVSWEFPSVLPIIIERPNKENSVQVSFEVNRRMIRRNEGQGEERSRWIARLGYARHSDSISATAETEMAFKDYRSLA